jgi:TPR repeat protein
MYYGLIFVICLFVGTSAVPVVHASDLKDADAALESGAYQRYVETLQELDKQGHAEAQDKLGMLYCVGRIVPLDLAKAHELFEKAAKGGSLSGMCHLGVCYQKGAGVNKNLPRARELFETADTNEYDLAPLFIADMYKDEKQYSKAIEQIERSRARGSGEAPYELARLYYLGQGVKVDHAKANALCLEAAEAGSTRAIYHLAWNYKYAKGGMNKDYKLANLWAQKGSAKGDSDCLELLSDNYLFGYGAAKDTKKDWSFCYWLWSSAIPLP